MSQPASAIDRYLAETFHSLERALVTTLPELVEPRVDDPLRALRRLGLLIETLAGFALGSILGAVRRELPESARRAITGQLIALAHPAPPTLTPILDEPVPFLADATSRPLLDALGAHVHTRLCRSMRDARTALTSIERTLAPLAPDALHAALDRLAGTDHTAVAFADHLALGWQHYAATLGAARDPDLPDEPRWNTTRGLWRAFRRRIDRPTAPLEPTHEQVREAGYMMRIG